MRSVADTSGVTQAAALVATVGSLAGADGGEPFLPPTAHLHEPDPECDLDYTPLEASAIDGRKTALINCLAFGAKNSAVVVRVAERAAC